MDEETWEDDLPTDGLSCDSFELQDDFAFSCQECCQAYTHFEARACFDAVQEDDSDDADETGEWVPEPVSGRKPFLDQFKI